MRKQVCIGLLASLLASPALADSNDFMAGRLFQIALEIAPQFEAAGAASVGTLATGAAQTFEMTLASGTCYTWIAAGDSTANDLDITVYAAGTVVAGDDALDDWPVAQYCSTLDTPVRVDLLMYSGSGGYAFNTYSRFFGGADQIELHMNYFSTVYAEGATPAAPITRATLPAGAEERFPLALSEGQCYTVIGTSGAAVEDLDLFLEDAEGTIVSSDEAPDNYPVVGICPPANGNYTLRARMYGGAGEFGWQLFSQPPM